MRSVVYKLSARIALRCPFCLSYCLNYGISCGAFFTAVTRAQDSLREDSDFLTALAERELEATRSGRGWNAAALAALPAPLRSRAVRKILADGGIEPSALRINTAISLLEKRSARFNPCRDRFFTIRKGVCFVEHIEQHYKKHEK